MLKNADAKTISNKLLDNASFSIELSTILNNNSNNLTTLCEQTDPIDSSVLPNVTNHKYENKNAKSPSKSFLSNLSSFFFKSTSLNSTKVICHQIEHNSFLLNTTVHLKAKLNLKREDLTSTRNNNQCSELVQKSEKILESRYGWCVVFACCWCFGFIIAIQNCYSLIYNALIENYKDVTINVIYAAWIGSASNGVQFLACIPSSMIVNLIRPRLSALIGSTISTLALIASSFVNRMELYFITFSFIFAIGQSLLLISTLSILPYYFNKRLGLANGLMNFGGSFITITMPLVTNECLNRLGLSSTWLVLSSLSFITILCSFIFKAKKSASSNNSKEETNIIKQNFGVEIFKKTKFIVWSLSSIFGIAGSMIPLINITHHNELNFLESRSELLNVIFALFSGFSALVFGKLGDKAKFSRLWFHMVSFLFSGIIQCIIPHVNYFFELCLLIAVIGICDGLYLSSLVPILFEISKTPELSNQATGYYHAIIALPVILGPTISAAIFEHFGSYTFSYYLGAALCLISSIIFLLNPKNKFWKFIFKSYHKKNPNSTEQDETIKNNIHV